MDNYFLDIKKINIMPIIVLLIFYIPSSNVVGGFQFWYLIAIGIVLFALSFCNKSSSFFVRAVFSFFLINIILLTISLLVSGINFGTLKDFNEFIRLIGSFSVFLFFYYGYSKSDNKFLVSFFKIFLVIQLLVCFLQSNDTFNNLIGVIWNTEKVWIMRRTGTFGNPNILSIFSIAAYSFIFFNSGLRSKVIFGLILFFVVLFTSSKTGMISLLIILNLNYLLLGNMISIKSIFWFLVFLGIVGFISFKLLYLYQNEYPYLAQIVSMFENDMNVNEIKSIGDRQLMWDSALDKYKSLNFIQKTFGIGPGKDTEQNVIDNEFLTILLKLGVVGCIYYFLYFSFIMVFLYRNIRYISSKILFSVMVLFLLSSGSASTFMAWHLSLLLFMLLGINFNEINVVNRITNLNYKIIEK